MFPKNEVANSKKNTTFLIKTDQKKWWLWAYTIRNFRWNHDSNGYIYIYHQQPDAPDLVTHHRKQVRPLHGIQINPKLERCEFDGPPRGSKKLRITAEFMGVFEKVWFKTRQPGIGYIYNMWCMCIYIYLQPPRIWMLSIWKWGLTPRLCQLFMVKTMITQWTE